MIIKDLSSYSRYFSGYTELRVQENRSVNIVLLKGNVSSNSRSAAGGVSARVYKNGYWGFSTNTDTSAESIKSVINAAGENAGLLDSLINKGANTGKSLPVCSASSINDFSTKKPRLKQKELIDFAKDLDNYIALKYPALASRYIRLHSLDMEKTLLTSDGSSSYSMVPRAFVNVSLSVDKDGSPVELWNAYGGVGQFEDVFDSPGSLYTQIDMLYEDVMKKREGVYAEAGTKTCILDADLAGILAHEAIGHTVEADFVMGGSVGKDYMGKEAAAPMVSIVDFANTALGKPCPVPVFVDDEGVKAEDVTIIDKGILKNYMHNKESAQLFGAEPKGNARAFDFSDEPLIRMRNTVILPGKDKLEDMIASVDDGYYLMRFNNGQSDATSEFMFGVTFGYEIKKGRLGRAIMDTTISGVAFDVLKTVTAISDDEIKWVSHAMCGKKQWIPASLGGTAIKCKINIGGK